MHVIYDYGIWWLYLIYDFGLFMTFFYDGCVWDNLMWYLYLVKYASLTCCYWKRKRLQMYLIDKLPMQYNVNLFQFILNLMEVMCLVQEYMKCSVRWLKLTARISSRNKGIETCNNMLVKHFRSKAILGHWYPIVSIDVHEHAMTSMMC